MDLSKNAMLVSLSISQWTARKLDKKVTEDVAQQYGHTGDWGRYNKVLVAQEAIKAINKIGNEARTLHYNNTLPWNDLGQRILPAANYGDYKDLMHEAKSRFDAEVRRFISNYPALVEEAKAQLNGMFDEADYPNSAEIESKYGFNLVVEPMAVASDFRVELSEKAVEEIRAEIEARSAKLTEEAMDDLWKRTFEAVRHMAEKLADEKSIFRNSLVENVAEIANLLPKLNVTGDELMTEMADEIKASLTVFTPEELRTSREARRTIAKKAREISEKIKTRED